MRKPRFRPSRRGWILIAVGGLLLSSFTADAVASIGRVRTGVRVGTLELGGRNAEEAEAVLAERARLIASEPVEFFGDRHKISVDPEEIAFFPDVDATRAEAMLVGRQGNFFVRLWHRLRTHVASTDVGWTSESDDAQTSALVDTWAEQLDDEGREAGIEARGSTVVPVDPVPGRKLDQRRAARAVVRGFETWPRRTIELPFSVEGRRTDRADAEAAAERANDLIRSALTLEVPGAESLHLTPAELAPLLDAVPERGATGWRLAVRFDPERVEVALAERLTPHETEPRSATFSVRGSSVSVNPSQDGTKFDPEVTAQALLDAAGKENPRVAVAAFAPVQPQLTTAEAEALNITELVSSFTTQHKCCQPRVHNIHRMADIVDGTIIRPGETFSLNRHVGKRTTERGFVLAPMIYDGEYKDDVGGGVSQFATTFYNAIFFGGYTLDAYKAHSYYISRYPAGREATVSWPSPDLKFTNNSGAGILAKTAYSSTSITVSFYGSKGGKEVSSESGERTNFTDPPEQRKFNPALPPGTEMVVQKGGQGFDIIVWRIVRQGDDVKRERFFTRYKPEPRIIEHGPEAPPESPPPDGSPEPGRTPEPPQTPEPAD